MCGICGKLSTRQPVELSVLEQMCDRIAHRGPDDQGVYVSGQLGLGNRRLAILDLSPAGHQPMSDDEGRLWITYNGEVYNYRELRDKLQGRGHHFRSGTDTEVVLHAYQEWGPACLDQFNGMFAFAIWDAVKQRLFLARDRLGIKPLYYSFDGYSLVFASETKAILADPSVSLEIDPRGVVNYFTFGHAVAPDTIFRSIKKLLPGHYLLCAPQEGGQTLDLRVREFWAPPLPSDSGAKEQSEDYYVQRTLHLLKQSVQRQLVADVPVGVFLSGGIDSSAITALMSSLISQPIKTFSIGFTNGGAAYNELEDARRVAQHFGTDHHECLLSDQDMIGVLEDLAYQFDEPFGDAASVPTYLLSRFARTQVPVALSGEGGDEIFGGYRRYVAEKFGDHYRKLPAPLTNGLFRGTIGAASRSYKVKKALGVITNEDPVSRYAGWFSLFTDDMRARLFSSSLAESAVGIDSLAVYHRHYPKNGTSSSVAKALYLDQRTWLPDTYLEKVDKASMAVGLETRVPFLDHELVEFAATIPAKYKVRGTTTKYILKKALAGVLPPATLKKPKHGFAVPTDLWFKGELNSLVQEVLFDSQARSRGLFNHDYVHHLYQQHREGKARYHRHLWLLVMFEIWCRRYGITT